MNQHWVFIIIGAAMGILPGLVLLFLTGQYQLGFDFVIPVLLAGGVLGSIGGWIGGAIIKKKWGAVLGGLLGTIIVCLYTIMPS